MRSPKDLVAWLLFTAGLPRLAMVKGQPRLTIFGYHSLLDEGDKSYLDFDDGVVGPTPQQFRNQLRWLQNRMPILSEGELASAILTPGSIDTHSAMITFDDGYRDNYDLALPILEELKIPATFFVPSGLIEHSKLGWWDIIPYFLKRTERDSLTIDGHTFSLPRQRRTAIAHLHQVMKTSPAEQSIDLLQRLSESCEVPFPDSDTQRRRLMSWEQVKDASDRGVTIGSHSHSHRVLSTLSDAVVTEELSLSKRLLEARIGRTVRSLAFPCGGYDHFSPQNQMAAMECGFELCFSFNTGTMTMDEIDPGNLKRIGASPYLPRFGAMTAFPRLLSWPSGN